MHEQKAVSLESLRLGIQQRVLPDYRAVFFETLAKACPAGVSVFAGHPSPDEMIVSANQLSGAEWSHARNLQFLTPNNLAFLCWQSGLIRWLESWQPSALIVEANPRYISTRRAIAWMHKRKRPVLGWGLGAPLIRGAFTQVRRWERQTFLHSLDGVIAYSQRGAEEYRAMGIPGKQVFVAPNAAALRPTHPLPERPATFAGTPIVLFVGRLQARKRIDLLLHACASLPEASQPRLIVVGDGPAKSELEALAQQVFPSATFTGDLRGNELAKVFLEADLFVLPGTGGLAIQQAMSYGLPVIVAQGDGTQADLVRPENGWVLPLHNFSNPADASPLQKTLGIALEDPSRLRLMGRESYRIVKEEINLESMTEGFLKAVYSTAIITLDALITA